MKIDLNELIQSGEVNIEQFNLASKLDEEELKKIGDDVYEDFNRDLESRSDWLQKHADWKKLYNQTDISTDSPWENSSQDSVPVMTEACNSFQARAFKAFFPNRDFLDAIPIGRIDETTSQRIEKVSRHMSFQLGVLDKNYKRDKNAMFLASSLNGSDFTKTYFDPIKKQNVVERVRAVDLVVPYNVGPIQIEDVQRKTHIIRRSLNDAKILKQSKYFIGDCEAHDDNYEDDYQQVEDDHQGIKPSGESTSQTVQILEQHTLLDLDGDGIKEPYIVWVDRESKKTQRIQIRYEVDDGGQPVNNKQPVEYFDHYKFLENPDGFYGYGMGHLIGKLNTALNKILRQLIDAGTLANTATGFVDDKADVKGGEIEIQLGKFIKMANFGERISDAFFQLQFPGPNNGLAQLMQQLESYARSLSSVTDVATGDLEKVYQPTTITAMLEQSLQLPTSVMEQMAMSFQSELQKIYKLNGKYLDQESFYNQNNQTFGVTRQDYADDLRVIPIFDPRNITKQQKIAKAQSLFQFVMQNPLTATNQNALYEASVKMLEALEIEDIQDILPQPNSQQPQEIDDQRQENMYFLMPATDRPLFDVFPQQDHKQHMSIVDELLNGPFAQEIDKEMLQPILDHRKKHVAYLYMQSQLKLEQYAQGLQGSVGNVASQSNNPQGLQVSDGSLQAQGASDALFGNGAQEDSGSMGSAGSTSENFNGAETGLLG